MSSDTVPVTPALHFVYCKMSEKCTASYWSSLTCSMLSKIFKVDILKYFFSYFPQTLGSDIP